MGESERRPRRSLPRARAPRGRLVPPAAARQRAAGPIVCRRPADLPRPSFFQLCSAGAPAPALRAVRSEEEGGGGGTPGRAAHAAPAAAAAAAAHHNSRRPAGAPATSPGAKWSNGPFSRGRVPLRRRSHPPGAWPKGHTPRRPAKGLRWGVAGPGVEPAGARPDPPHPPSPHAAPPNPNPHPAPSAPSRHGGGAGGWIGSRGCAGRRWRRWPPPSPGFHPPEGIYIILISHSLITITSRLIFSYSLSNQTKARSMSKLELFLFHKCKILTTTLFLFKVLSQKILKICQM